jgi:hypothetical protein
MIKFKKEYKNSVINLPGKVSINSHNVNLYAKFMQEKFPHMIEGNEENKEQTAEEKLLDSKLEEHSQGENKE